MKTIDTFLCIGGPADGQLHPAEPGMTSIRIQERLPVSVPVSESGPSLLGYPTCAIHYYNRFTVEGEQCRFRVWLHERSNSDDAFKRLIDCYAKGKIE